MKKLILLILMLCVRIAFAQQPIAVTDSSPVTIGGLKAGYRIVTEKEKEVGNKGNFSRYSIEFFVTNVTNEAKIILYKQFNLLSNEVSPEIVLFRCSNATGARMTVKDVSLRANPCVLQTLIDEKECSSDKTTKKVHLGQIGYWIKPGETISARSVMIVPLNERPNFNVFLYPNASSIIATVYGDNNAPSQNIPSIVKIRKFSSNDYLNNQNGPLVCSAIGHGWWSASWQLIPVSGTNYYLIKNRGKNNFFISTDNNGMLSLNDQSANTMWVIEPIGNTNTYTIRNASNNSSLISFNGSVQAMPVMGQQPNAEWIIEQQ